MKKMILALALIVVTFSMSEAYFGPLGPSDTCLNGGTLRCQCNCLCPNGFCGTRCQERVIHGCKEIRQGAGRSGVYNMTYAIQSGYSCSRTPVLVFCDMCLTTGKAWTVIQRRINGHLSFYRTWTQYENGFGDPDAEFWIGNKHLAAITQTGRWILRIEMVRTLGNNAWAEYSNFKIGSASTRYTLQAVGGYTGTAGDSLSCQVNNQFSTYDQDNDKWTDGSCAVNNNCYGAWWYGICSRSNLNGFYGFYQSSSYCGRGINWETWGGYGMSLLRVSMLIRPYEATSVSSFAEQSVMVDLPGVEATFGVAEAEPMGAVIEAEEPNAMQAGGAEPDAANIAERAYNGEAAYDAAMDQAAFANELLGAEERGFD